MTMQTAVHRPRPSKHGATPPEWASHLVINRKLLKRNPASSGGEPEKTMPFRVWDVRANKLLCELPRNDGWLSADKQGRVSISTPPASVDGPNCRLQALNIPGRFFRDGDFAAVMDGKSGQLTLLDPDTLQVRKTVTTQVRGDYVSAQATAPGSQYVIVGNPAYGDDRGDDFAQVFDSKTGQLVQQPAGRLRGSTVAYTAGRGR
ncbi:YncE family protein [Pandoraea communis]|uniref:YncE family protein n=1 Tax=Pandoraea communis TaxID=2508297 RepID=UPI001241C50E|nr:hypothetical protein [Pandoraea communis]